MMITISQISDYKGSTTIRHIYDAWGKERTNAKNIEFVLSFVSFNVTLKQNEKRRGPFR